MTVKPKIELTLDSTLALLTEVVRERGDDFIYETVADKHGNQKCVYEAKGAPSCLVGEVLHRAGISLAALKRFDRSESSSTIWSLADDDRVTLPKSVVRILSVAQGVQDVGRTWGDALVEARRSAADDEYQAFG